MTLHINTRNNPTTPVVSLHDLNQINVNRLNYKKKKKTSQNMRD